MSVRTSKISNRRGQREIQALRANPVLYVKIEFWGYKDWVLNEPIQPFYPIGPGSSLGGTPDPKTRHQYFISLEPTPPMCMSYSGHTPPMFIATWIFCIRVTLPRRTINYSIPSLEMFQNYFILEILTYLFSLWLKKILKFLFLKCPRVISF